MRKILQKVLVFSMICMFSVFLYGCDSDEEVDIGQTQLYNYNVPDSRYVVPDDAPIVNPYSNNQNISNLWDFDSSETPSSNIRCSTCRQTGKCPDCGGSGRIYRTRYAVDFGNGSSSYEVPVECELCDGGGRCYRCQGTGYRTW
uniref:CR-type domain-containing protein n=1 Tax=Eubacterium plexicaudatum ASF492 TaxID=1235802 RepID=N2AIZ2_9FIRM